MKEKMVTISARIPDPQAEEIEKIARERGVDRSAVIRELLSIGIVEFNVRRALELLRERKVSVWRAAEIAGVTYREMLDLLRERNVPFPLSAEELKKELEEIAVESSE